ncbi:MAG: M1 family metallopeptidase [Thermoanaerobaculia bacterium]|nr:M1 family metallopeptidase [Thermoanaerobaculia bacterium]
MYRCFYFFLPVFLLFFAAQNSLAQCNPFYPQPLSPRPANYTIRVTLDDGAKTIDATQTVRFTNHSPAPIRELRFYLYLNAFKNTESTFLKGTTQLFGQGFTNRGPDEWGWIEVDKLERETGGARADLFAGMRYVQPDDGNAADQSVLAAALDKPLLPGETAILHLKWRAKMPKTIARAGYSRDFYLFCHWFPQLGVWEQNSLGAWDWNCHQFMRHTEFYADFGTYDVFITTDKKFVLGASGCLVSEKDNGNGTLTRHYHAEDVIDFAWSVYPRFMALEDRWRDVHIRLLLPPEHAAMGPRYLDILKFAFEYMDRHVGQYLYPSLTVVDPPFHGLRSGLMEYPTLITVGTIYGMPEGVRTSESLLVHEFVHQYFMGMLASNEKEEPWLDEGFVTYFEDRIIDAAYGDKQALVNLAGYRFDNRELSRLEYTTMRNPRQGIVARPGWLFSDSNDRILQTYFGRWKFKHPRGSDFMAVLHETLMSQPDSAFARRVYGLFETAIYGTAVLDYAVTQISNEMLPASQGVFGPTAGGISYRDGSGSRQMLSKVEVQRKGDWVFPVELRVTFEDGTTQTLYWPGGEGRHVFEFSGPAKVISAQIDPHYKLALDTDLNNNSLTLQPDTSPLWKYAAKAAFWIQNLLQTVSFLA